MRLSLAHIQIHAYYALQLYKLLSSPTGNEGYRAAWSQVYLVYNIFGFEIRTEEFCAIPPPPTANAVTGSVQFNPHFKPLSDGWDLRRSNLCSLACCVAESPSPNGTPAHSSV